MAKKYQGNGSLKALESAFEASRERLEEKMEDDKKKYTAKRIREPQWPSDYCHYEYAKEMQEKYGLHDFKLSEIVVIWVNHSEDMCAGWLVDSKEEIESVFGVKLEEILDA